MPVHASGGQPRRRPAHRRLLLPASMLAMALTAAGCSSGTANGSPTATSPPPTNAAPGTTAAPGFGSAVTGGLTQVPGLVDQIEPSVVTIMADNANGGDLGSGVVIRPNGIIVTNNHVVAGATSLQVALADGTRLPGTVQATDPVTDLAIVHVERTDLPAAGLATTYPEVGEMAVAVGNPFGFNNTVTAGIVSGLQRSIPASASGGSQALVDLIQTDAAISPGNSGGALVDASGKVIGITVAYVPPTTGAVNLGFAIPAPTVSDVVDQLIANGKAVHPYLGVQLATITQAIAQRLHLSVDQGVVVVNIEAGTPAASAGLKAGDVITAIAGKPVATVGDLLTQLRGKAPGDSVTLAVQRGQDQTEVTVTLGSRPAS